MKKFISTLLLLLLLTTTAYDTESFVVTDDDYSITLTSDNDIDYSKNTTNK